MGKIVRLTESQLVKLIGKVVSEQEIKVDQNAKKLFDTMVKKVNEGFCTPTSSEGNSIFRIYCKDGHYFDTREYRQFGKK